MCLTWTAKTNRIALSRKRLLSDPWDDAQFRYHEGQLVAGYVTNVVDFGAFVALDDGLEGLLHLSEMGDGALKEPHSYVQKGDHLSLRISHLEPEKRRVGFTQRWGTELDEEEGADSSEAPAASEAEAEVAADEIESVESAAEPVESAAESADEGESAAEASETSDSTEADEEPPTDDD